MEWKYFGSPNTSQQLSQFNTSVQLNRGRGLGSIKNRGKAAPLNDAPEYCVCGHHISLHSRKYSDKPGSCACKFNLTCACYDYTPRPADSYPVLRGKQLYDKNYRAKRKLEALNPKIVEKKPERLDVKKREVIDEDALIDLFKKLKL